MNDVLGIINLSESEESIKDLTLNRNLAAIPILGRYRVIDFALSNMVNSGLTNVAVFTYGKARSLIQHLGSGKHWGLDRKKDGLFVFYPEVASEDNIRRNGDINNFKNHLDYLKVSAQPYVIMSRSYMICNIDYTDLVKQHKKSGADITIAYKKMDNSIGRFVECDTLFLDEENNVVSIGQNLGRDRYYNVSMEMYVIKRELLIRMIEDSVQRGDARFLKEAIFNRIGTLDIKGYRFHGYLSCVNSIQNYFETNMDLLNVNTSKDLFSTNGRIYTKVMDAHSVQYLDDSYVVNSLVANGTIIEGTVENSVICRDVHIKKGSIIRNSVVLPNVTINETTNLNYVILDKNVVITEKKMLFGDVGNLFVIKKNMIL